MDAATGFSKLSQFKFEQPIYIKGSFAADGSSSYFKQGKFLGSISADNVMVMYDNDAQKYISAPLSQIDSIQRLVPGRMGPEWQEVPG